MIDLSRIPTPTWVSECGRAALYRADCLDILPQLPDGVVDAVVTDPPYGLKFMGKEWDRGVPGVEFWDAVKGVMKPGAHLLAFGGTRTYHRLACAIEDAGFEIRDQMQWLYGTGFPKSLNVSKAIDKAARGCPQGSSDPLSPNHGKFKGGCSKENEKGRGFGAGPGQFMQEAGNVVPNEPVSGEAAKWDGWGTALKPANEPICLARNPLSEKTVVKNVLRWGTGALNIDACRVETNGEHWERENNVTSRIETGQPSTKSTLGNGVGAYVNSNPKGRYPANVIHDGSEEVQDEFDKAGVRTSGGGIKTPVGSRPYGSPRTWSVSNTEGLGAPGVGGDTGSAARFFYCAKAAKSERNLGLEGTRKHEHGANGHPTVKPVALIKYLTTLVTPPDGTVLDPFMGSGTTGVAAAQLGRDFIGVEIDTKYFDIAVNRIKAALAQGRLFDDVAPAVKAEQIEAFI